MEPTTARQGSADAGPKQVRDQLVSEGADGALLYAITEDGWKLSLRRIGSGGGLPVLLLHGFGANGFVMWHEPGISLGGYLKDRGFQVWVLEFRGTRAADDPRFAQITPSDKIVYDLPAALELIMDQTGAEAVDVVGHSLGGTLLYAHLALATRSAVRRFVTIASPLRFRFPHYAGLIERLSRVRGALPRKVPIKSFCRLGLRTDIVLPARDHFNLANVERSVVKEMMMRGVEDASFTELSQIVRWSAVGELGITAGGAAKPDLRQIRQPALLIGGAVDRHVPREHIEEVYRLLGSEHRQISIIGRASGAEMDYGHTDLLLGLRVETEVFPLVADWLSRTDVPTAERR